MNRHDDARPDLLGDPGRLLAGDRVHAPDRDQQHVDASDRLQLRRREQGLAEVAAVQDADAVSLDEQHADRAAVRAGNGIVERRQRPHSDGVRRTQHGGPGTIELHVVLVRHAVQHDVHVAYRAGVVECVDDVPRPADQVHVVVVVVFVGHQDEVGIDPRIVVADPQGVGIDRNTEVPVRLDRDQPLAPEADRDRLARVSFEARSQQEYRKRGKTGMSH